MGSQKDACWWIILMMEIGLISKNTLSEVNIAKNIF
jgi:hypothetical protein